MDTGATRPVSHGVESALTRPTAPGHRGGPEQRPRDEPHTSHRAWASQCPGCGAA